MSATEGKESEHARRLQARIQTLEEGMRVKDKLVERLNKRCEELQSRVQDKEDRIRDLERVIHTSRKSARELPDRSNAVLRAKDTELTLLTRNMETLRERVRQQSETIARKEEAATELRRRLESLDSSSVPLRTMKTLEEQLKDTLCESVGEFFKRISEISPASSSTGDGSVGVASSDVRKSHSANSHAETAGSAVLHQKEQYVQNHSTTSERHPTFRGKQSTAKVKLPSPGRREDGSETSGPETERQLQPGEERRGTSGFGAFLSGVRDALRQSIVGSPENFAPFEESRDEFVNERREEHLSSDDDSEDELEQGRAGSSERRQTGVADNIDISACARHRRSSSLSSIETEDSLLHGSDDSGSAGTGKSSSSDGQSILFQIEGPCILGSKSPLSMVPVDASSSSMHSFLSYQWYRYQENENGTFAFEPIPGAADFTYMPNADDVGGPLRCICRNTKTNSESRVDSLPVEIGASLRSMLIDALRKQRAEFSLLVRTADEVGWSTRVVQVTSKKVKVRAGDASIYKLSLGSIVEIRLSEGHPQQFALEGEKSTLILAQTTNGLDRDTVVVTLRCFLNRFADTIR